MADAYRTEQNIGHNPRAVLKQRTLQLAKNDYQTEKEENVEPIQKETQEPIKYTTESAPHE